MTVFEGITYYPSSYYALAVPCYIMVSYLLLTTAYIGYNMIMTNDPSSKFSIHDDYSYPAAANFNKCSTIAGIVDFGDIDPMSISLSLLDDVDVIH